MFCFEGIVGKSVTYECVDVIEQKDVLIPKYIFGQANKNMQRSCKQEIESTMMRSRK